MGLRFTYRRLWHHVPITYYLSLSHYREEANALEQVSVCLLEEEPLILLSTHSGRTILARPIAMTFFIVLACLFCSDQAMASGDFGCTAAWRLAHHNYNCGNNVAMLAPSNDTRVNLLLIMADLHRGKALFAGNSASHPDPPLFDWDEMASRFDPTAVTDSQATGSDTAQNDHGRCPATTGGEDRFPDAIKAEKRLAPAEQDALLAARKAMRSNCAGDETEKAIANAGGIARTTPGKAFAQYLLGALYFWQSNYDKAAAIFASLSNADTPWVKEVSLYMAGRTAINRAQLNAFDDYGSFKQDWKADPKVIADSETALDQYLRAYPKGEYARSARGLKRRGYWLGGMTDKLAAEYSTLLGMDRSERNASDTELAQEIDHKLLPLPLEMATGKETQATANLQTWTHDPAMLTVLDLYWMRTGEGGQADSCCKPMSRAVLEAQKPYFAEQMPLYQYLLAAYAFYVEKKPADVLHLIPDAARQGTFSYLQFSRQMLRGMSLEAVKDHNAPGFWMQMLPGATQPYQHPALELAIAYHDERAGVVSKVFDADSPVHYPYLRRVLLSTVADAGLLRKQAKNASASQGERDVALFTLLYKEATRGHAADFLNDLALVPANAPQNGYFAMDETAGAEKPPIPLGLFIQAKNNGDYGCPALRETEAHLAQEADNPTALLCLADFFLVTGINVDGQPPPEDLGGTQSLFPGGPYERMQAYQSVLANPKASADNKAYALYRAVRCYAPSGNNGCGGKDVPIAQRKAWFNRLKQEYPSSRWARELKYYW